ncbi:MAG TPA: Mur ligase domain-containing protein [Candidatus Binatia bacterium]|nr:Mur ligase domain-containing protein [Candidatus Binatia bacterium]
MHIYFSGIGGAGMAPLAMVAKQVGYKVSGSDKQTTQYLTYLKRQGITDTHIGQGRDQIEAVNAKNPIDWFVYSSAVAIDNPEAPELEFCRKAGIRISKRDELLNQIIETTGLKLVAIAGTHGKTTTTAMVVWLFKQLDLPISYLLPAKVSFGPMGSYTKESTYLIYEADEFDRNFLTFEPHLSLISGVSWDHHEIFKTRDDYKGAFRDFISQSDRTILWQEDFDYLELLGPTNLLVQDSANHLIELVQLKGHYNRLDAWLAIEALHSLTRQPISQLMKLMNGFPGLQRRMEKIIENLYSDYAHTPEKIRGAMSVASEIAAESGQRVIVVYEPLTDRRQHYMLDDYKDCFEGAAKVYWLPSYLAREDPNLPVLSPAELIAHLSNPSVAEPAKLGSDLKATIAKHLDGGDLVVCMAGGGGNSLDEWLRQEFGSSVLVNHD